MDSPVDGFAARAARIPIHGIGLSVDVFSPDVLELHQALERAGSPPEYLEIFKAPTRELARVRAALPDAPLAYHAEGLWLIDPAMRAATPWTQAVETIARHTGAIGAWWANHECAGKQFSGYSFGTYLPPLFTRASADAIAANAMRAQAELDGVFARRSGPGAAPLLLLELPPLTYCGFGDLPVAEFFARIAEQAHCGLVLDVGHLWTHWRYRERRRFRSPEAFAADFCVAFPMDRVIQVHLAGLGAREQEASSDGLPFWIDAHDAPVPGVLFDLLRQVLGHPALTALKGVALEVDTKAIPAVVEEFGRFREELAGQVQFAPSPLPSHDPLLVTRCNWESNWCPEQRVPRGEGRGEGELARLYEAYARVVSGQEALETSPLAPLAADMDRRGLMRYTDRYLPHELLCWGGDLAELFPPIWSALERRGITAENFIRFWFSRPRPITDPYDFFYVKLDRWVEFIGEVAPDLMEHAAKDAEVLRALHDELNDEPPLPDPPPRGGRERGGWNLEGAMTTVRINKYFTERGFCSRRAADRMIDDGRVRINGRVAVPGDRVAGDDRVTVDGRVVRSRPRPVYLAYHKPVGVTCTTELHVPGNILHAVGYPERIFPIGRLDKDSSGLILLTNDGDIVNRILRAEFGHEREYVVTVDRPFPPTMLRRLEQGVPVLGEKTRPCWTTRMDAVTFRIRLTEGRNRQIRRMCSTLGYRVVRLVRVRIMHIRLGGLPVGQWREFSPKERDELLAAVGMREERAAS